MASFALTPANCTHFKIRRLMRLVARTYDRELGKTGLVATQFTLLTVIRRHGPLTLGELAKRLGLDASTLTRNLKPLQNAGWVKMENGPDARQRHASITAAGEEKQQAAEMHWATAQQALNAELGPDTLASLNTALDDALDKLQASASLHP